MENNDDIKTIRKKKNLTQKEVADMCGIPLRTYQNYETLENKKDSFKYEYIIQKLKEYDRFNKENGIYEISEIKELVEATFSKFKLNFVILIGDYSLSCATPESSIDFIIGKNELDQNKLNELKNELQNILYKNIVLINYEILLKDKKLLLNTLSKGVRIYG